MNYCSKHKHNFVALSRIEFLIDGELYYSRLHMYCLFGQEKHPRGTNRNIDGKDFRKISKCFYKGDACHCIASMARFRSIAKNSLSVIPKKEFTRNMLSLVVDPRLKIEFLLN